MIKGREREIAGGPEVYPTLNKDVEICGGIDIITCSLDFLLYGKKEEING